MRTYEAVIYPNHATLVVARINGDAPRASLSPNLSFQRRCRWVKLSLSILGAHRLASYE